jgi:hypothetical protein
VSDKSIKAAKDLSTSLHYLSSQHKLTKLENQQWKASFEIKKKHETKKQTLPQLFNLLGSMTLSPSTISQSLKLIAQRERDKLEDLAQRAQTKAA